MKVGGFIAVVLCSGFGWSVWGATLLVNSAAMVNDATLSSSDVFISSNSTLSGNGVIAGNLTVAGTLSPGITGAGTQTVSGSIGFTSGSRFVCDVQSHTALDRLSVSGPVTGVCRVVLNPSGGAYPIHQPIILGNAASAYAGFTSDDFWLWRLETTGALNLAVTHLRGDTDSDSLPDWWESDNFGGRTNAQPSAHSDADGADNRSEYIANTDPLDETSLLELTGFQRSSDEGDVIAWSTAAGRRYCLLVHTNLPRTSWSTAAVITAYGTPQQEWTNAGPAPAARFYEISVEENTP